MKNSILNIKIADFCEDSTTVELSVVANEEKQTFFVQTHEGRFNTQLGCWLTAGDSEGENIDRDDYTDFDFDLIVTEAEKFINEL